MRQAPRAERPLTEAAADYEQQLTHLLGSGVHIRLGLLGLGADGHTASLFSDTDLAAASGHLAVAVHRPDGMYAVSVTPQLLAQVEALLFVAAGEGKRDALQALEARDPGLTAWRAVQGSASVELWTLS